jgi:predicted nucleic acid-binding protein
MSDYLADNNHVSAAIARVSDVREPMYQAHRAGTRVGTCFPVICELETGIQQTHDPDG